MAALRLRIEVGRGRLRDAAHYWASDAADVPAEKRNRRPSPDGAAVTVASLSRIRSRAGCTLESFVEEIVPTGCSSVSSRRISTKR